MFVLYLFVCKCFFAPPSYLATQLMVATLRAKAASGQQSNLLPVGAKPLVLKPSCTLIMVFGKLSEQEVTTLICRSPQAQAWQCGCKSEEAQVREIVCMG